MDQSTLLNVALIRDLMIIVSLSIWIVVLITVAFIALKLIGPIKSLTRTARNLEETSVVLRDTSKDVSRTFSMFGNINRVVERVRERVQRGSGQE
ncbi:MAG: hypothetical protein OXN21_00750 [Chloroflexota bacterium]|nr:hypothetical protein [Chloroflexota bacterium]